MEHSNVRDIPQPLLPDVFGISAHALNQLRAEGMLDCFGEQISNRWYYSYKEVTRDMALLVGLARAGLGYRAALEAITNPASDMIAVLAGHAGITLRFSPRRDGGVLLSAVCYIVVDASAIVAEATRRLEYAIAAESVRSRRRLAFDPVPAVTPHR